MAEARVRDGSWSRVSVGEARVGGGSWSRERMVEARVVAEQEWVRRGFVVGGGAE